MYNQRLSNRENHRQFEGVSAPPAINIRVHRNEGNMPYSAYVCLKNPQYVPDDALFYYQIAFNAAHGLGLSFAEGIQTNGFHPLWMVVCYIVACFVSTKIQLLYVIALICALLNGLTIVLLRNFIRVFLADPAPSMAILIAAPYFLFVGTGMEGHLSNFLLVALLHFCARFQERRSDLFFLCSAVVCGLIVASRLDLAIVIAPLAGWLAWSFLNSGSITTHKISIVLLSIVSGIVPASIFLLHNFFTFGNITPISGLLKLAISAREGGVGAVNGIVIAYIFVILTAGAICLTSKNVKVYSPVVELFAGQIMFVIYVILFNNVEVGSWYFVSLSVTAALGASLIYTNFVDRFFGRVEGQQVALFTLLLFSGCLSVFLSMRYGARTETWSLPIAKYFASNSLSDVARRNDVKRVVAFDRPGELAFFDGLWVIPADGLTTNLQIQRDLDSRGVEWLIEHYGIDALVLPPA
jgi:hypothetical protein